MPKNFNQQHSFLVFENTQPVLSFNDIDVFSTGASLPWTFYTNELKVDAERGAGSGYASIMMTAESKEVTRADGSKVAAGTAVTKLRTYSATAGQQVIVDGNGAGGEVTAAQYLECGWPLVKDDKTGEYTLPKYGEFTFCKGYKPSFEDASQIGLNLTIGFGLNTTIYNYQQAELSIGVHNLSVEPTVFVSDKVSGTTDGLELVNGNWTRKIGSVVDSTFTKLEYNNNSATYTGSVFEYDDVGETEEKNYKYLYIKVEKGEGIRVDIPKNANPKLALQPCQTYKLAFGKPGVAEAYIDTTDSTKWTVKATHTGTNPTATDMISYYIANANTTGKSENVTSNDIGKDLGMDFFVLRVRADSAYNSFSMTTGSLPIKFFITPIPDAKDTTKLRDMFKREVNLNLSLLPNKANVYIRDDLTEAVHGFYDHGKKSLPTSNDLSDMSNFRQRIIVTAEEATHFAYNYGHKDAPGFISAAKASGKTAAQTYVEYQLSLLTATEKKFDAYKSSFADDTNKLNRFIKYVAVDLSGDILTNFSTGSNIEGDADTGSQEIPIDLSNVLDDSLVRNLQIKIKSQITNKNLIPTLPEIQARCGNEFGLVYNKYYKGNTIAENEQRFNQDMSGLPYSDSNFGLRRALGEFYDASEGKKILGSFGEHWARRNTLLGQQSTLITTLFGLHEYKTGVYDPLNPIGGYWEKRDQNNGTKKPYQLIEDSIKKEWAGGIIPLEGGLDLSGDSPVRPTTSLNEMSEFRRKINPVNGASAIEYLCKMMRIKEKETSTTMGDFTYVFGTDNLYRKFNKYDQRAYPSASDINALLYRGNVPEKIIGYAGSLINRNVLSSLSGSREVMISNPSLICGAATADTFADVESYKSVGFNISFGDKDSAGNLIAADGQNYTLDKIRPESYGKADQSAVFYTHFMAGDDRTSHPNNIPMSKGFYGDASGIVSSFYRDGKSDKNPLANKWYYTKLNGMINGFGTANTNYTLEPRHPNGDLVNKYLIDGSLKNWYNTTNGNTADEARHTEGIDFSGIIKIPAVKGGKYFDVFAVANGGVEIEIPETIIDVEEECQLNNLLSTGAAKNLNGKSFSAGEMFMDMSNISHYRDLSDLKENGDFYKRKEILRSGTGGYNPASQFPNHASSNVEEYLRKYKLVDVGAFQFFRIGSIIRVIANGADIDADRNDCQPLPTLKFRLRGAAASNASDKMYELLLNPLGVKSEMIAEVAPELSWSNGFGTGFIRTGGSEPFDVSASFTDHSSVFVNRFSTAYIPIKVSGFLEQGEKLSFELSDDKYYLSGKEYKSTDSSHNKFFEDFDMSNNVTDATDGFKYKIEMDTLVDGVYKNNWTEVTSDTVIEYECHNKDFDFTAINGATTVLESGGPSEPAYKTNFLAKSEHQYHNSHADASGVITTKEGKDTKSSNIKGKPRFRMVLPPQLNMINLKTSFGEKGGFENEVGDYRTALRKVTLKLKTNSDKVDSQGKRIETHSYTIPVTAYVTNSPYDPNIRVQEIGYKLQGTELKNASIVEKEASIIYKQMYKHSDASNNKGSEGNQQNFSFNNLNLPSLPGDQTGDGYDRFIIHDYSKYEKNGKEYYTKKLIGGEYEATTGETINGPYYNLLDRISSSNISSDFHNNIVSVEAGVRDISSISISAREDLAGPTEPIARILIDENQNKIPGENAVAEIVPLFRKHDDWVRWNSSTAEEKANFEVLNDTFTKSDTAGKNAADSTTPVYIPANDMRYGLSIANGEILLYRKEPENYNVWTSEKGLKWNQSTTAGANFGLATPELVTVAVRYTTPSGYLQEKQIMFFVHLTNSNSLEFVDPATNTVKNHFVFNVAEGESEVDITQAFCAKAKTNAIGSKKYDNAWLYENGEMGNKFNSAGEISLVSDEVKYAVFGTIDQSGLIHLTNKDAGAELFLKHSDKTFRQVLDLSSAFDQSMIVQDSNKSNAFFGASFNKGGTDVGNEYNRDLLSTYKLGTTSGNTKMMIYHENVNSTNQITTNLVSANGTPVYKTNNLFNHYTRKQHQFLLMAYHNDIDVSRVDRNLALVTINVKSQNSGFYLDDSKSLDSMLNFNVTETLGTKEEGRTESENNPEIAISNFTSNFKHPNLGTQTIQYKLESIDDDLIVCPPTLNSTANNLKFTDLVIKLKDIPVNKTMELKSGQQSLGLADYAHYNFERKSSYKFSISATLDMFKEIFVEKAPDTYICNLHRPANAADILNGKVTGKNSQHTTYIMKSVTNEGNLQRDPADDSIAQDASGMVYYFKNEKGFYEGPLVTAPQGLVDLFATKKIHGTSIPTAYVRYENNQGQSNNIASTGFTSGIYTPLYKGEGFSDTRTEPPVPKEKATFDFTIRVTDTFDLAKQSPQPYQLTAGSTYADADPPKQILIDPKTITAKVDSGISTSQQIAYLYADYGELELNFQSDFKPGTIKPSWAVDFSNTPSVNSKVNKIKPIFRKIHPFAGLYTNNGASFNEPSGFSSTVASNNYGSDAKYASGPSSTYGVYPTDLSQNAGVFLDMFVEYPPVYVNTADVSGWNVVQPEPTSSTIPFGKAVDVSMNVPQVKQVDGKLTKDDSTAFRTYQLHDIARHQRHTGNEDLSGSYYTKGKLMTREGFIPTIGKSYKFIVAAVSSKLATPNDVSYNTNMVEHDGYFFNNIKHKRKDHKVHGNKETSKYNLSYQKYVYDPSGARIRTYGQARSLVGYMRDNREQVYDISYGNYPAAVHANPVGGATAGVADVSANGAFVRNDGNSYKYGYDADDVTQGRYAFTPGALLVCRTKMKVTFAAATQSASSGSVTSTPGVVTIYKASSVSNNVVNWGAFPAPSVTPGTNPQVTFTSTTYNSGRPATATYYQGKWTITA